VLHDAQYTEVSENSVTVESDLKAVVIALAAGPEGEGLIGSLDADLAEDEMDANAFAASLDEEGAYAEAVWDRLNETALARTRTSASAAGIYADTDADTEICENTVDVAITRAQWISRRVKSLQQAPSQRPRALHRVSGSSAVR
jgi:hypothetical protein